MAENHYAYAKALRDGVFETDELRTSLAQEIKNYERAVMGLSSAYNALDAYFTSQSETSDMLSNIDELICNIVHEVTQLQERNRENIASRSQSHTEFRREIAECAV
ncbi:MAG: hypothetical protein ABF443_15385 [Acetobacter malorum]|uniref:hypothetical protein n=1 Tax=Acetobacter malorum TaxID=178901 RepID=UPI0039EA6975